MSAAGPKHIARLAVMISGGGRTLVNLEEQIRAGRLPARIALVIASRECEGADKARSLGLETRVEPGRIGADALEGLLREHGVDWVVLAGYLKLIEIPTAYAGRMLNIHPSLLPRHGGQGMHGLRVHGAVLAAGDAESGCTVHMVDAAYDSGAIVLQRRCPVMPGDTPETLAARVFREEREAYPEALRMMLTKHPGPLRI